VSKANVAQFHSLKVDQVLTEVDFRWYFLHTYESPLLGTTLTKIIPLLRKSLISYGSHLQLRNSPSTTELTFSYGSHSSHGSHFNYGSQASHENKFKLRKSTSSIDGLPKLTSNRAICTLFTELHFRYLWWSTKVHFWNSSWSTEVHFRQLVAYESQHPELNHLQKSTSDL